jgi:hypothetical protein
MSYLGLVINRNLHLLLTFISVSLSILVSLYCFKAIKAAEAPYLIAIDSNGTRLVTREDDPIFQTEAVSFIKTFLERLHNFSPDTFIKSVGFASELMSLELWEQKKEQITSLQETVNAQKISLETEILGISKVTETDYQALLKVKESSRITEREKTVKIKLSLLRSERRSQNPWGIEVKTYEEIY